MDSQRTKLENTAAALKARYNSAMRGRMVPSSQAMRILKEMDAVQKQIKALDQDAAERLALEKAPIDEMLAIIAIPLLADVMNDIVARVDGTLRRHGVQETVFGIYTSRIRKAALAMVDTLDHSDANLPRLLDVDDTLVSAVRKKLMSFIKQRLNITEQ